MNNNGFFVYFLTTRFNKVLYIGVTRNLVVRYENHQKSKYSFVKKYGLNKLVYFERHDRLDDAIRREKQLKNWHRDWKNKLVDRANPEWRDLKYLLNCED